ncbi:hypothetical protein TCAL_16977 [Tigriopus californicus]|uniref:Uncharacterized protein n=1 Tax=Tigriopus californicus TaxID=6832 RepID=A0A553PG65_TIGCA|nr:uncharacterized protein LOC131880647 [Tigriopus californicus]TRY76676.1 hypothetical protein TCAL_16977 [Tigriopus californicus]
MNRLFVVLALTLGSSLADVKNGNNNAVPQFAEPRDTSYGVPSSTFSDSSFNSGGTFSNAGPSGFSSGPTFTKPITYSSGQSFYSNDPGFNAGIGGSFGNTGGGLSASFPSDLISTGLNLVLGLFAFSLIMQIVTKVASSSLFDNLFKARALESDNMVELANFAMKAYRRYEEMNNVPK